MNFTIANTVVYTPVFKENNKLPVPMTVEIKVLTAKEVEEFYAKIKEFDADSKIVLAYCLNLKNAYAGEKQLTLEDLLNIPGTSSLFQELAKEFMSVNFPKTEIKNE